MERVASFLLGFDDRRSPRRHARGRFFLRSYRGSDATAALGGRSVKDDLEREPLAGEARLEDGEPDHAAERRALRRGS